MYWIELFDSYLLFQNDLQSHIESRLTKVHLLHFCRHFHLHGSLCYQDVCLNAVFFYLVSKSKRAFWVKRDGRAKVTKTMIYQAVLFTSFFVQVTDKL